MPAISDWKDLPFQEIWCVDTEFYPGSGLANGGKHGDRVTPLCLTALELRSGRLVRLWQNELGPFPPYRLDSSALFISYNCAAEFGFHLSCNWGEPACALDAYVEFRHLVNDGAVKSEDRPKGFHSLAGALQYFCEDGIDIAHKDETRDRILLGPPFSLQEKQDLQLYCEDDARGLARLVPHIVPIIRSLPHAMFRAKFQWVTAVHERRGVPVNLPLVTRVRQRWQDMRLDLVRELDQPFGCYEVDDDGVPHWRRERFAHYVRHNRMAWPKLTSGQFDETDETFREMAGRYPQIEQLRELRYSLAKLKLADLAIGSDGRNRAPLWAYGTKTARNAPSATGYIFGPAKWIRHFIAPPPGCVLVHRDYRQQEVRIAAVLSGDPSLLQACETGDIYLGIAEQLGFVSTSMNEAERKAVRALFKCVVLGIQYGLGAKSLAARAGISHYEAREVLARLRARFHRFEDYARSVLDHAGLELEVSTPFGWTMQCPSGTNPRTIRNFPMQSTGSEILHVACVLAERRGIEIVAPIHDALMAEGALSGADELSHALDQVMGDSAAIVLRGYRLPTDCQVIRPGEHYKDERGAAMWDVVTNLVAKEGLFPRGGTVAKWPRPGRQRRGSTAALRQRQPEHLVLPRPFGG